ncbi:MAG TPA: tRNA 4-thiouridine(8) synthase ThiI [Deltaproteobacteria bacterium]|nr:tRNA 4-thiouridine(8) synthase ThiI [Deltaproteobacteria bacterium]
MKAVGLLSGGLDSTLAVKLLQEQGIEVIGVTFMSPFFDAERGQKAARQLEIPLRVVDITDELIPLIRSPKYGRGSGMNPCIDCHALMLRRAGQVMEAEGASFLFTGEVLGQRPFSQTRRALRLVEKESGYEGLVLRPLSAKLLPETVPERRGWVDRERLLDIRGRGRKRQTELAKRYGIRDFPSPAGGCLLTDPVYARRLKDLLDHQGEITRRDLELLRIGRHLRISAYTKAVVGRNEGENRALEKLSLPEDLLMEVEGYPGPLLLIPKGGRKEDWGRAAGICLRYSDAPPHSPGRVRCRGRREGTVETMPLSPEECEGLLL